MNEQEYRYWVNHVQQVVQLKDGAFEDFQNWHNRALLSRLLANMNLYMPGIELMESILEEAKREDDEHYIWALSDLANYYWVQDENKDKVIELINEAIDTMNRIEKSSFPLINKGFLYNQMWQILALAGEAEKVNQQIESIIRKEGQAIPVKTNSVLFYSYFNLALFAYEKADLKETIDMLLKAYSYSDIKTKEIDKIISSDLLPQRKIGELMSLVNRYMYFES